MGQTITKELVIAVGTPLLLGQLVGAIQGRDSFQWFAILKKPFWCPPAPVFPVVWTTLYALMGYASYLVYQHGGYQAQKGVLVLYGFQLVLNLLWPVIFFKAKKLKLAQAENLVLLAAAGATARNFYKVDPRAGRLLFPYIAWLVLANALNLNLASRNYSADEDPRLQDNYHPGDKRNPGEQGYRPTTAALQLQSANHPRSRGRLQVFGQCSQAQARPAAPRGLVSKRPQLRTMPIRQTVRSALFA